MRARWRAGKTLNIGLGIPLCQRVRLPRARFDRW